MEDYKYQEPWHSISDYPDSDQKALLLQSELSKELSPEHQLFAKKVKILALRQDCDDMLVESDDKYFIVHLTWSSKKEPLPWPSTEVIHNLTDLLIRLKSDTEDFLL